MIQWLQKYSGIKSEVETIEESELENLRREMNHYKKKYEKEDKEMEVSPVEEEKISPEEQIKIDEEIKKKRQKKKEMRPNISAEVYDKNNEGALNINYEERKGLDKRIKEKCFLFQYLDENELNLIINSFETKNLRKDEKVISQGEIGNSFYIVEYGELECEKVLREGDPPTFLRTYKAGDSFGELSLLYSTSNPETITSKEDSVLWYLDRNNYTNIIKNLNINKRKEYGKILRSIEILKELSDEELEQICDALKIETFKGGEEITKQNDLGDKFYIVEKGSCQAIKITDGGKQTQVISKFEPFQYFGELSLIKSETRPYTYIAETDCQLLILDRMTFKRLLGPIENILKRDMNIYAKYMKK